MSFDAPVRTYQFATVEGALRFAQYLGVDTFADTFEEKHALGWGIMAGVLTIAQNVGFDRDGIPTEFGASKPDIMPEKHYFDFGKCIGRFMVDPTFRAALGLGAGAIRFQIAKRRDT